MMAGVTSRAGRPLDGILVADFSRVLAGPLATMTLADLGARVIKVERPGIGDETRTWGPPFTSHGTSYFEAVNRSKESIALDLTDPADLHLARELARRADVLVENFAPGTLDRLGLSYDEVAATNPGVIYCSISGFGRDGGRDLLGYDFVVQAVGGLMSITGEPGAPTKAGVALVDVLTGKDATIGILAALAARARTGRGDRLDVTLLTSSLGAMVNQAQSALEHGRAPTSMGNKHPSIAPYETLSCVDSPIAVACGNDGQFRRLATVLGMPSLADDPRFATNSARVNNRAPLIELLEGALAGVARDERNRGSGAGPGDRDGADTGGDQTAAIARAETAGSLTPLTAAAWVERISAAGVPVGRVGTILDGLALAESLGLDPTIEIGAGFTRQVRHPVSYTAYETSTPSPPPDLGEHDEALRAWLSAAAPQPTEAD